MTTTALVTLPKNEWTSLVIGAKNGVVQAQGSTIIELNITPTASGTPSATAPGLNLHRSALAFDFSNLLGAGDTLWARSVGDVSAIAVIST